MTKKNEQELIFRRGANYESKQVNPKEVDEALNKERCIEFKTIKNAGKSIVHSIYNRFR